MKRLRLGMSFLTVLPLSSRGAWEPGDLGRSAGWFPLIGAAVGGLVAASWYGLSLVFPPLLAAVLAVVVWIVLTGGMHLDGVADCCDGLLNAASRERRLEIMKDPRLGTFGATGLFLTVLLKVVCLFSLPVDMIWMILPLAAGLGRFMLLWAGKQPLARPDGMGADFAAGLGRSTFLQGGLFFLALIALAGWWGLLAAAVAHALAVLLFWFVRGQLGGVTGDVFGLLIEWTELAVMLVFIAR
jgi:adenosylcobinamide-GDP ribazoletransferase